MEDSDFYTHAMWRVRPGSEQDFIEGWTALGEAFRGLSNAPLWGTLLRNEDEPSLFYSFGPWRSFEDIASMRADASATEALARLRSLCEEATPGRYRVVARA